MLLDVEAAVRVEAAEGQQVREEDAERVGDELGDEADDVDARVAEGEELVDAGAEEDEDLLSLAVSWRCAIQTLGGHRNPWIFKHTMPRNPIIMVITY